MRQFWKTAVATAALCFGSVVAASAQSGEEASEQQIEVDRAKATLESFIASSQGKSLTEVLQDAEGVLIVPQLLRAGFIWGGSGGTGVMMSRQADNTWTQPAFYGMADVTFGLQAGGESAEVIFVVRTKKGAEALLSTEFKLGAGVSVAFVTEGAGASTNLKTDLVAFSRSKGLFGGLTVNGSVIKPRDKWNEAYYGQKASATDILVRGAVSNAGSFEIRETLRKTIASGAAASDASSETAPAAEAEAPATGE